MCKRRILIPISFIETPKNLNSSTRVLHKSHYVKNNYKVYENKDLFVFTFAIVF